MGDWDWRPFVYGGIASITAEFGTFPIDTTKTRLQIQGQAIDARSLPPNVGAVPLRYNGMIDAFVKISRTEGTRALYSGIWPAVLRQATYGTIKFGTYYTLKSIAGERDWLTDANGDERVWANVLCAVTAGAVSSAIATPTDVLKVRMQVHGRGTGQRGLFGCFVQIYRLEGVRGLWRGVGPTAQRAAVIAAVELPVYDFCKLHLLETFGDRVSNHFVSSFVASLGSAIASTPIDVVRTRLMNQQRLTVAGADRLLGESRVYSGSFDCAVQSVRNEGLRALYKGFIPTWVRMGPWNIIFFITYEHLKQFY